MTTNPLPFINDPDFTARVSVADGPSLQVLMNGTADMNTQKVLQVFLASVHACAIEHQATTVVLDMRGLDFMNSSCLKRLVNWIFVVRAELPERKYRIVFVPNPKASWQRRSLHSLSCMAPELVSVQQ
jgi:hypothetical protein